MIELIAFLKENAIVFVAISALLAISGFLLFPLRFHIGRHRRPDRVEIVNPEAIAAAQAARAEALLLRARDHGGDAGSGSPAVCPCSQ